MAQIDEIRLKSGVTKFASILGKSTIAKDHPAYKFTERTVEILFSHGYGIIHGGYAGGAMSAASDTANRIIAEQALPRERNIGVPQKEHDGVWGRVADAVFIDAAEDIFTRLWLVTSGDIAVVCPLGGDGTELEETIVFHENVITEALANTTKGTLKKPKPLIFLQLPECTDWRTLLEAKISILDTSHADIQSLSWLYFIDSAEAFEELISSFK